MKKPPYPSNEAERLAVLRELLILDTDPEARFDAVTQYCHSRFNVEIALVSLIDQNRQWFKSACGLSSKETPRDISFCGHAILGNEPLVVNDARLDERFHDNPLVTGPPFIRFYAGAPLKLSSGHAIGTLCLIDPRPRRLEPEEREHLSVLAAMVARELENLGHTASEADICLNEAISRQFPGSSGMQEEPPA